MKNNYLTGIDIGSTTAKVVIFNDAYRMVFSRYCRHNTKIIETIYEIFKQAKDLIGEKLLEVAVTGSAGMGFAKAFNLPFVQEVVASGDFIKDNYKDVRTYIEIGGEDSKIIFFDKKLPPEIRMNGTCAGGTGAFIDQMAVLLNVSVLDLNALSKNSTKVYPIASRCGVFAKTDVAALLSKNISKEDIAASVFHSVVIQVITSLTRGMDINKKILIGGGPLTFYPELIKALSKVLDLKDGNDLIIPEHPELIPVIGTCFANKGKVFNIRDILSTFNKTKRSKNSSNKKSLTALFKSCSEFELWKKKHDKNQVHRVDISQIKNSDLFLGIDSGSTTTKIVVTDDNGQYVFGHYCSNNGNSIDAVKNGLLFIKDRFEKAGFLPKIVRSAVTGYGEDLIKAAFSINDGIVETIAHYRAAGKFTKDVSFILDIGGQDMKAISIKNNAVCDIQINEACSSGCGSFIETFAVSMGYDAATFAEIACKKSNAPFDLGTRCTVFMNSMVKQALKDGVDISDISAGLAYSIIKNSLYKVLKISDPSVLGDKIVVQGGTFRNNAVLRALELLLKRDVIRPDISELMGAYGAALIALEHHQKKAGTSSKKFTFFEENSTEIEYIKKEKECSGCENRCLVEVINFSNGNSFFTGNRCERYFCNKSVLDYKGKNLIKEQTKLLFEIKIKCRKSPALTFGLPRCLNMYENFPFWKSFLTVCGFKVVLSSPSDFSLYEEGAATIMSENICMPAKLAHGHIFDLIKRRVDRIFYPIVVYERKEFTDALDSFNCPIVTGYPDVLNSSIDAIKKENIPFDSPAVSFKNIELLKKQLYLFFKQFGVNFLTIEHAVASGLCFQEKYHRDLYSKSIELINNAKKQNRRVVVLAGRPYHIDPLINHGIAELLNGLGVDVVSGDSVCLGKHQSLGDVNILSQWAYSNRLLAAAKYVTEQENVDIVHLISFGCGTDAVSAYEVKDIITKGGKKYTQIKIDEIANLGAIKIRLRSMLEVNFKKQKTKGTEKAKTSKTESFFMRNNSKQTLITPYFSPFYSPLIPYVFKSTGCRVDVLPLQNKESISYGLKYLNNDMCYPAIITAGDIIKAFDSGKYDHRHTSVLLPQTGGQCRASSYACLIKKGLSAAGFDDVPVITISPKNLNMQIGFIHKQKQLIKKIWLGIIFADPLAQMYLSTAPREKIKGNAKAVHLKYLAKFAKGIEKGDYNYLLNRLKDAVAEFNKIDIKDTKIAKIGLVGEIFVKYNCFSNMNILDWFINKNVEVVLPALQTFFTQRFINETFDQKMCFKQSYKDIIIHKALYNYVNYYLFQINSVMQNYRFYKNPHNLKKLAKTTGEIVSLANQSGEGWLLTAEMVAMLSEGIGNIVCLQPFGCIANHITGNGIGRKLKRKFNHFNLLSLDMDSGTSEVNILNRLHFMINRAKKDIENQNMELVDLYKEKFYILSVLSGKFNIGDNYFLPDIGKIKSKVSDSVLWKKAGNFIEK